MIFEISRRASRILFLASFAALSFLPYFSIRNARAAHALGLNTRAGYERAVELEPGSAHNWLQLGRFYQNDFEQGDPAAALRALLVAHKLAPSSADVLLELATNYDDSGKNEEARAAYLDAKRLYPLSAEILWRYGNFLLRQGEISPAFSEIHSALQLDPRRSAEAFSRCHRVVSDKSQILDKVIPPNLDSYLDIIFDLTNAGQLDDALFVWSRAAQLTGMLKLSDVTTFANALVQSNRVQDASRMWQEATQKIAPPLPADEPRSLVWDGGFETGYRLGGLGWHFESDTKGVQISFDRKEKHSGSQSLRLVFAGRKNLAFSDVCHWVPVEPDKKYRFSAWVRAKSLTSDQGVRFLLYSRSEGKVFTARTAEVHGDSPWTSVALDWTAPPESRLVSICAARDQSGSSDGEIAGSAWIDDVALIPVDAEYRNR